MASHFSAIGMPFADEDTYLEGVQRIAEAAGEPEELSESQLLYSWRDDSGAAADVLVEVADGQMDLRCITPRFDAASQQRIAVSAIHPDDECPGCGIAGVELKDENGEMAYPMFLAPARMPAIAAELAVAQGKPRTAHIGLLAEELGVFADEAAFRAGDGEEPGFAAESFIPMGMFGGDPEPRVLCNGTVVAHQIRRNTLFGTDFGVLTVRSLAAEYDVAYDLNDHPDPVTEGMIVSVTGWASATLP